jgi:hypothetical protein
LTNANYNVINGQQSGELPVGQQLKYIKTCDLFVGIYAHAHGVLPDPPAGQELPLPIEELNQARQSFRRCLIYVAADNISDVTLTEPTRPVPSPPPVREKLPLPAQPLKDSEGLTRLIRTIWNKTWDKPTPKEIDRGREAQHIKELCEFRRRQEELDDVYRAQKAHYDTEESEKKRIYDEKYQEYKKRIELQELLLSIVSSNFRFRRFTSATSLVIGMRQDLDALERGDIFGLSRQDVMNRWQDWVVYQKRTLQEEFLDGHPLLTSPVESHLGKFLGYSWHEEAEKRARAVVAAAEEVMSFGSLGKSVRDKFESYCQLPVDCQSYNYPIIARRLIEWCSQEETKNLTKELRREVKQLGIRIQKLPDTWSGATKNLRSLLNNPVEDDNTWKEEVMKCAQEVIIVAEAIYEVEILDQSLRDKFACYCTLPLDLPTETSALTYSLRMWCPAWQARTLTDELREHIEQLEDGVEELCSYARKLLKTWEDATDGFHKCVINPVYGKCLLVMGRTGSGKTHLVARLLQNHGRVIEGCELRCVYLPFESNTVSHQGQLSIEQALKDATSFGYASTPKGPQWRSFEELARFVLGTNLTGDGPVKLVIIIDGLELWVRNNRLDLKALHEFIEQHTTLHHVHWVLCISEADYDLVAHRDFERFCGQYGFVGQPHMPTPSGWIGLDALNEQSKNWKEIICDKLDIEDLPPDLAKSLDEIPSQLLTNPFIAWLVAELIKENRLRELPNLNYISFVEEFWKRRLTQLLSEKPGEHNMQSLSTKFWRAIYLIARIVVEQNSLILKEKPLAARLVEVDGDNTVDFTEDVVRWIVGGLLHMSILKKLDKPEYGDLLTLDILPLWQWQSGAYLLNRLKIDVRDRASIRPWLRSRFVEVSTRTYLEGVLEFLALLADREEDIVETSRQQQYKDLTQWLAQDILYLPGTYRSVVWLAASKASAACQHQFGLWLVKQPQALVSFEKESDLHRYLYFLKFAEPPDIENKGLSVSLRMQLIRNYYNAIHKFKYGEYFKGFLESLVENAKDGSDIARAFAYLYGIESFLNEDTYWANAEALGNWTYDSLRRLAGCIISENQSPTVQDKHSHTVHQWMLEFLEEVSPLLPAFKFTEDDKHAEYKKHWGWMIWHHCKVFADSLTIEDLTWLENNHWFKWNQSPFEFDEYDNVPTAMEEQLTVVCGKWFREKNQFDQAKRDSYIHAVEEWAATKSSGRKRVALFLIYHAVPAKGKYSSRRVNEALWQIFERLRDEDTDPEIQRLMGTVKITKWYDLQTWLRRNNALPAKKVK